MPLLNGGGLLFAGDVSRRQRADGVIGQIPAPAYRSLPQIGAARVRVDQSYRKGGKSVRACLHLVIAQEFPE